MIFLYISDHLMSHQPSNNWALPFWRWRFHAVSRFIQLARELNTLHEKAKEQAMNQLMEATAFFGWCWIEHHWEPFTVTVIWKECVLGCLFFSLLSFFFSRDEKHMFLLALVLSDQEVQFNQKEVNQFHEALCSAAVSGHMHSRSENSLVESSTRSSSKKKNRPLLLEYPQTPFKTVFWWFRIKDDRQHLKCASAAWIHASLGKTCGSWGSDWTKGAHYSVAALRYGSLPLLELCHLNAFL